MVLMSIPSINENILWWARPHMRVRRGLSGVRRSRKLAENPDRLEKVRYRWRLDENVG